MPDDKFNGRYIDQALVKGNWYGISSGPKPQVFTGNIDNATGLANGLEDIRNKALYLVSPNSANGTFPEYGHKCTVLTTRYGDDVYLQKLFDIDANVEYERVKLGNTQWKGWQRVTSYGDASQKASDADTRSRSNETAINDIYSIIGGRNHTKPTTSSSTPISDRVYSNSTSINSHTNDIKTLNGNVTDLFGGKANDSIARKFLTNNDVRAGQLPGIKFYANTNEYTISNSDSVQIISAEVCSTWGANETNSIFFVSNANGTTSSIHVEGGTYVPGSGWYAVWDGNYSGPMRLNWMLVVFNQSMS